MRGCRRAVVLLAAAGLVVNLASCGPGEQQRAARPDSPVASSGEGSSTPNTVRSPQPVVSELADTPVAATDVDVRQAVTPASSPSPPSPGPQALEPSPVVSGAAPTPTTVAPPTAMQQATPTATPEPTPEATATPSEAGRSGASQPTPEVFNGAPNLCDSLGSPGWSEFSQWYDVVRWSPDGSEIFFNRYAHGSYFSDRVVPPVFPPRTTIYAVAADGSYLREVTRIPRDEDHGRSSTTFFDVSPDGASLVYSTCEDGSFDIARVTVDGSRVTPLTDAWRFESLPAWSPDGSRIAFLAADWRLVKESEYILLRTMTPDGAVDQVHDDVHGNPSSAVFSPPSGVSQE